MHLTPFTQSQTISEGRALASADGSFELGFFSPGNSTNRYLGIWYKNIPVITVIWVANRNNPIKDLSGVLKINTTGNLVLLSQNSSLVWSANSTKQALNPTLQLLETGNLTGLDRRLSAWKNWDDPSPGDFTWGIELHDNPEIVMWKGSKMYYRSGPWNGLGVSGAPELKPNPVFGFNFVSNENEISREGGSGCAIWYGHLIDIRQFSAAGQDLYVRMPASEIEAKDEHKTKVIVIVVVAVVTAIVSGMLLIAYLMYKRRTKFRENMENNVIIDQSIGGHKEDMELPIFDLATIAKATNNFSSNNKLGEGGFGPVYKGTLIDGQEIAVKRLSQSSGQGLNEFINEVLLIAKLQHRNLVKLLDFGLARTFERNQIEGNTNRVVGTYGYMAPEYAIDGLFSVKSDVFSFGILLLEIVSGKKNRGFYHLNQSLNLIGQAWKLWKEGRPLELIDTCLEESCTLLEIFRCIHVSLLCVQQHPEDRPNMSSVVMMLGSEGLLPEPKEPGFLIGKDSLDATSSSSKQQLSSTNEITITRLEAR
uniref:Protein kinase domain-containing protein n=1 Tax=Fagus sylvatica TaxID=28930 RepID=A0A2N9EQF3_FAGSY